MQNFQSRHRTNLSEGSVQCAKWPVVCSSGGPEGVCTCGSIRREEQAVQGVKMNCRSYICGDKSG